MPFLRPCAALCILFLAAAAHAQEPARPSAVVPPDEPQVERPAEAPLAAFSFTPRAHLGFNADFDDEPGDLTVSRIGGEIGARIRAGERGQLRVSFDYEFSRYDFNNATGFAGLDSPWEDIHRAFVTAQYSRQASRQLVWFVGGSIGISGEDGADFSKAVVGGGFAGVRYHLSETLAVGMAIAAFSQLEDNWIVFPAPQIEWQFAQRWSLVSAGRPGVSLVYDHSDQLSVALGVAWESRDFRLDEDGPIPSGVGRERQIPVTLGVKFRPREQLELGGAFGWNFYRSYRLDDEDGNKLADIDADSAPFLGLELTYRF
jgi:hypothetical protein